MNGYRHNLISLLALTVAILAFASGHLSRTTSEDVFAMALVPPASTAQGDAGDVVSMLSEEAGIAAYVQVSSPVDLSSVKSAFRTVEDETDQYVIGSVPVEGYPESYDVHVFANTDGWIVAYYLADDPAAKMVDWLAYRSSQDSINTILERVLTTVAGVPYTDVTFYDFRYPQATHIMLVAEAGKPGYDEAFTVQLPMSFTFYESSWSTYGPSGYASIWLDGAGHGGHSGDFYHDFIGASQLSPGSPHSIAVENYGGIALVYKKN